MASTTRRSTPCGRCPAPWSVPWRSMRWGASIRMRSARRSVTTSPWRRRSSPTTRSARSTMRPGSPQSPELPGCRCISTPSPPSGTFRLRTGPGGPMPRPERGSSPSACRRTRSADPSASAHSSSHAARVSRRNCTVAGSSAGCVPERRMSRVPRRSLWRPSSPSPSSTPRRRACGHWPASCGPRSPRSPPTRCCSVTPTTGCPATCICCSRAFAGRRCCSCWMSRGSRCRPARPARPEWPSRRTWSSDDDARAVLRVTLGRTSSAADVAAFVAALPDALVRARAAASIA